jgi:hypothetical protein
MTVACGCSSARSASADLPAEYSWIAPMMPLTPSTVAMNRASVISLIRVESAAEAIRI